MKQLSKTVDKFLRSVGRPTDVQSYVQLFQLFRGVLLLLLVILLVKVGWTTDEVGKFELLLFASGFLFSILASPAIQHFIIYFSAKTEEKDLAQIQRFSWLYLVMLLIIAALILVLYPFWKTLFVYSGDFTSFSYFVLFALGNTAIGLLPSYFLVRQDKVRLLGTTIFYTAVFILGPVFLLIGIEGHRFYRLLASLGICYFLYTCFSVVRPVPTTKRLNRSFYRGFWDIVMYSFLGLLAFNVDYFLVQYYYGDERIFATFRMGNKEIPLLWAVIVAFSQAMITSLQTNNSFDRLKKGAAFYIQLVFPICIALMLGSRPLFKYVFSADYVVSASYFDCLLLLAIPRLLFSHTVVLAKKETRLVRRTAIWEFIINVGLSILLLQMGFGIMGIICATVVAYLFEKLVYVVFLERKYHLSFATYMPARTYFIWSFLLVLTYLGKLFLKI